MAGVFRLIAAKVLRLVPVRRGRFALDLDCMPELVEKHPV